MKRVRWWYWALLGAAIAGWVLAGLMWSKNADGNLLYNIAAIGTCASALVFIAAYTVIGLAGRAKWWQNTVGTSLMVAVGSLLASYGVIVWAVLFHHGLVNTPLLAWIEIGGVYLSFIGIAGLSLLWLPEARRRRQLWPSLTTPQ